MDRTQVSITSGNDPFPMGLSSPHTRHHIKDAVKPSPVHCGYCGKFVRKGRTHCNTTHYGYVQRGKSRADRTSPSRKAYVQIVNEYGEREYLHRYIYRMENDLEEIPEGMVVHHKNEKKRDNSGKNLKLLPRNEHTPHAHYHWKTRTWDGEDGGYDPEMGF
jgi:hypothetical protein